MSLLMQAAEQGERLLYRIAGLPVAVRGILPARQNDSAQVIRSAFARSYWRGGARDWAEIGTATILSPFAVLLGTLWFTARNGPIVRKRESKSLASQAAEQLKLYFTDGVLPPWYYIFALHGCPAHPKASEFLQRFETKTGIYPLLRRGVVSELNDKRIFADYCASKRLPSVHYLLHLDGTPRPDCELPEADLFVKRALGRGGRGAERWDYVGKGLFQSSDGERLTSTQLVERLNQRARKQPLLVQSRVLPHRDLAEITAGALPTIRMMTCLNEQGEPEVVGALLRTSIGANRTVDNVHAGGVGAAVRLEDGVLAEASDLGTDSRLGWLDRHPDTGAPIVGRKLPHWKEVKALAIKAHREFGDRVLVGWDIAITDAGPIIIEGNSSPDVDIMQRFGTPICSSRFGELLAWHLKQRGFAA
jgi:hypothetical protein